MKKLFLVLAVALLIALPGVKAEAVTSPPWFTYDNFTLTFGTAGNPGSANGTFVSDGQITDFASVPPSNGPNILYGYHLVGNNPLGAQLVGTQYITTYASTLQILVYGTSTVLWTGTGNLQTIVNVSGAVFPNNLPSPPSFAGQPANYSSIGNASFTEVGSSTIPYTLLNVTLGTFNWAYDAGFTSQHGNAQGDITVPEPSTLILMGAGLLSLLGITRKVTR